MDNQTKQEKVKQIENDFERVGLENEQQESIFKSLAMSLTTYHQCTGIFLGKGIRKAWTKSLGPLLNKCQKYENLLNSMNKNSELQNLAKTTWEKKLKLYPKTYKKLNKILRKMTEAPGDSER